MSKWGTEEGETLLAIRKLETRGRVLNLAAGDGRFNNELLALFDNVVALDQSLDELEILTAECPDKHRNKLDIVLGDIRDLPFDDSDFDVVFCTGTLHLFSASELEKIFKEIFRVLKPDGKILLDFATDIIRYDKNGNMVTFDNEGNYHSNEAIEMIKNMIKSDTTSLNFEVAKFKEDDLDESSGYQYIEGEFLVISGIKKKLNNKVKIRNNSIQNVINGK